MINKIGILVLLGFMVIGASCQNSNIDIQEPGFEPITVVKTNPTKLYMHYMPWFQSKDISGFWGIHWRMATKNPDIILADGKRQIAAHYYPLIGPYDSRDSDVIEYHLLLMKYAGIDGVLIDWYGTFSVNDYRANLLNSNALISKLDSTGLQFGIVYEEFTTENVAKRKGITAIEAAQADLTYMVEEYFNSENYIHINEKPLLLTFGPRYFRTPGEWTEIFSLLENKLSFLPLWYHQNLVGNDNSIGEFSWVDFDYSMPELTAFYQDQSNDVIIGSAYSGFHDYYKDGGWGDGYGYLSHLGGQTLENTLQKADEFDVPYVQLVTWNDFGEGTMIEPTEEFQFKFLESIQAFAGVEYGKAELELVHALYIKRKEFANDTEIQAQLDEVYTLLNNLEVSKADQLLNEL